MFTIIGGDGKEYGPVSSEQIRGWITSGRANLETRARLDDEAEWKRLGDFPEFASAPPVSATVATASTPIKIDVKAYSDDLIARAPKLDVFGVIGEAFSLWTKNFWPLVGVTAVVYLVIMIAGIIPLGSLFLTGILMGGLFYFYLGKLRGEHREFGDCFAGFRINAVQLMLTGLVSTLLIIAMLLPSYIAMIAGFVTLQHSTALMGIALVFVCVCMLPLIYFSLCWQYAYPLVIDKNIGFWEGMSVARRVIHNQWWRVFAVSFFAGIIAILGIIGLFIGIFLTIPIAVAAMTIVYERLFNPPARE